MSFIKFTSCQSRGAHSQTSIHNPEAIRRRKRKMINHEVKNYQLIIENAMLANLRTLKCLIVSKGNFSKIYEYDVIIPKCHRANEVSIIIENETEKISHSRLKPKSGESHSPDQSQEFEEILSNFDENEPILSTVKNRKEFKSSNRDQGNLHSVKPAKCVPIETGRFLSHPLVYPTIEALFEDIRFKTVNNIKPKYMIRQSDLQQIFSFAEVKRGE